MKLFIGSHSQGGTGYLTRIVTAAQDHDHIAIVVRCGQYQTNIYHKICRQLDMLHNVADVHFTYVIETEVDECIA